MIDRLLILIVRSLSNLMNRKFHENFDMTDSSNDLYQQGIRMIASGFVIPRQDDEAIGVYIVRYQPNAKGNRYGRYN